MERQHECDRPTGHATDGSVNQGPHPRAQASGARRRTEIDDPTTLEPGTNKNGTHRQMMWRPKQARKTRPLPQVKNDLPCDYSRVDRAGTVKPANRGAREVLKSYVNMTKARTQHSHPEGEPMNTYTWNTPKPLRLGQGQVGSVQRD